MIDSAILAARHYAPQTASGDSVLDVVSVRDMVVEAEIGIHPPEQGVAQRVAISLECGVYPQAGPAGDDIANVVSYDFLLDGIRTVTGSGHIKLAETVAERLAAWCLADRRVAYARVKVEKLDRLPSGRLSIEIVRRQKPAPAPNVLTLPAGPRRDG